MSPESESLVFPRRVQRNSKASFLHGEGPRKTLDLTHLLISFPTLLKAFVSNEKETKGLWEKVMNKRALPQKRPIPLSCERPQQPPTQNRVWLRPAFALCQGEGVPGALAFALSHPALPQSTGPGWAPSRLPSHLPSCLCSREISMLTGRVFCLGGLLTHRGGS